MSLAHTAVLSATRSLRLGAQAIRRPCRASPFLSIPSTRSFSKKKKGHDKDHDNTDALIPFSQRILAGEVYFKAEDSMKATVDKYRKDLVNLEARASGRVTPALLAPVRVPLPDVESKVKLEEIATVGVREGTTLLVTVFEEHVCTYPSVTGLATHLPMRRL